MWTVTGCLTLTALPCISVPSCSQTMWVWASTLPSTTSSASSALRRGAYYAEGINPRAHLRRREYIRAAPGLTGFTKCGGNYAASIKAGELAEEQGYAQVLWLDGVEKKYVEEVGSMNIMFKIDGKVYTAATVGTVLPASPAAAASSC